MILYPAIDLIDNKVVRLEKGNYNKMKIYNEDPLAQAKEFEQLGLKYLHLVDLDGARYKSPHHLHILENIKKNTCLHIDYGGGLTEKQSINDAFDAGADQVNLGSVAVRNRELTLEVAQQKPNRVIISADSYRNKIAIDGWKSDSDLDLIEFINYYKLHGIKFFTCTDIERDGMLKGSAKSLYIDILNKVPDINLIASGGVSDFSELLELYDVGIFGVIVGKAIYENKISHRDLRKWKVSTIINYSE